jgi:hypothetical protein
MHQDIIRGRAFRSLVLFYFVEHCPVKTVDEKNKLAYVIIVNPAWFRDFLERCY